MGEKIITSSQYSHRSIKYEHVRQYTIWYMIAILANEPWHLELTLVVRDSSLNQWPDIFAISLYMSTKSIHHRYTMTPKKSWGTAQFIFSCSFCNISKQFWNSLWPQINGLFLQYCFWVKQFKYNSQISEWVPWKDSDIHRQKWKPIDCFAGLFWMNSSYWKSSSTQLLCLK